MQRTVSRGGLGASRGLDVGLPRTRVLLLGFFLAAAGWLSPPVCAEVEIDMLGEMVLLEVGGEGVGGADQLEASMHSSFLHDFQEATERIRPMGTGETQQNAAASSAFPDSSAVVGRLFQMKVPNQMEGVYLGDIVKVSPSVTFHLVMVAWWLPDLTATSLSRTEQEDVAVRSGSHQGSADLLKV